MSSNHGDDVHEVLDLPAYEQVDAILHVAVLMKRLLVFKQCEKFNADGSLMDES